VLLVLFCSHQNWKQELVLSQGHQAVEEEVVEEEALTKAYLEEVVEEEL